MSLVVIGGNHRGCKAIVNELQDETTRLYEPEWLLADPKDNRAVQMAAALTKRFPALRPQPMQMKVQEALAYSSVEDTVILALDTLEDTLQTLASRLPSQRVSYQFAGRGPGGVAGTRLAIQGTICPGDYETESAAQPFLQTLAGMSQAASSRRLTGPDPLSASVLSPLRQAASRQTARHLAEKEREPQDLSGSPLSVMFGPTNYPLRLVQGYHRIRTHSGQLAPLRQSEVCRRNMSPRVRHMVALYMSRSSSVRHGQSISSKLRKTVWGNEVSPG
jgi:hypothetical protein